MELVYSMPCYGSTFFRSSGNNSGKVKSMLRPFPEVVYLGIHHHGIHIFDKTKRSILWSLHIEDIYRWGFKPKKMFYFEFNSAAAPGAPEDSGSDGVMLEFDTPEGNVLSDLLTDYAVAFLKEREREDDRLAKMKSGKLDLGLSHSSKGSAGGIIGTANAGDALGSLGEADDEDSSPPPSASARKGVSSTSSVSAKPPPPPPSNRAVSVPPPPPSRTASGAGSSGSLLTRKTFTPKERAAVVKIQALFRGFSLRNEWAREDAAILLQSVYRGYRARVRLSYMIEQMFSAGEI